MQRGRPPEDDQAILAPRYTEENGDREGQRSNEGILVGWSYDVERWGGVHIMAGGALFP